MNNTDHISITQTCIEQMEGISDRTGYSKYTLLVSDRKSIYTLYAGNYKNNMSSQTSLKLEEVIRFREGNKAHFKKIYDSHYGLVKYTVIRCGIANDQASDIVQDVFIKLFLNRENIIDTAGIKSWLVTTARNLAIDGLRKVAAEQRAVHSKEQLDIVEEGVLQGSILHELEVSLIGDLIDEVSRDTNDATFSMFYRDGLPVKEIASIRNESTGTITNRLSRLRKKFHQKFLKRINELRDSEVGIMEDLK